MSSEKQSPIESSGVFFSVEGSGEGPEGKVENQAYRNRLTEIVSDEERGTSEKLQAILQLGAEWFGVENGHLAHIDPAAGTHTITEVSGSHPSVSQGARADLSTTYCRTVLAEGGPLVLDNASEQGWEEDPAYQAYELSTYLGAKVVVGSRLYGTVCFVDREPRGEPFTESDAAALALIGRTIGQALERGRGEDRLRRTRARLEALLDESPDMIDIHDREGNIILPNPRLCEKTGYEEHELVGIKIWDLGSWIDPTEARGLLEEMEPGEKRRLEGEYECKDGSTFPVEVNLRCLDLEGEDRFIAIGRDVTERKRREEALRREKERFESLVRDVEEYAIFMLDAEGRVRSWNEGAERIKGYSREEIIGTPFSTFYTEEDRKAGMSGQNLQRAEAEGSVQTEGWRVRKDGSRFWADVTITALRGEEGGLRGFTKVTRDMSEKKERERELRRQRQLLQQAQRLAGAWEVDPRTGEGSASEEVSRILEIEDKAELTAKESFQFFTSEARTKLQEAFEKCVEEGKPYDLELPLITAEGNRRWVRTVAGPAETEGGEVTKVAGAFQDITERKESEQRRRQVISRVTDAIVEVDSDWRFTLVSDQAEELYDRTEEDLLGENFWDVFSGALGTRFEEEYRGVMASREPTRFEEHYPGLDGWFDVQVYPNDDGGVAFYFEEITERKERERRLDAVFNHTYQFTGLIEPDGTLIEANDTALQFGDLEEEDVLGRPIWDTFWFKGQEPRQQALKDAVARAREGEFVRYEVEVQGAEENRIIDFSLRPITDEFGNVTMIVPEGRDITERKERTRKLRSQGRQLEQIRKNVTDVVWISTPGKDRMEFISDAYEDVWGRAPEALKEEPTSFVDGIHPKDRERVRSALKVQGENPEAYDETYRVVQPDGDVRWVQDRAAGIYDESGQLERIIGVATDITEQRKREQALQERKEKMQALYEATDRLLQAETKEEVSASILNLVNDVFGYPIVAVRLLEDGQFIPVRVSPEIPKHMPERPSFDVEGESVVAEVFRSGETAVFDDLRTFEDPFDYGEVRATAIVPIGEHGTISVADLEVGTIEDFDRRLIEILSAHAATVLDRVEREEDLREERDLLERIFETSPVAIVLFNRGGDFVHASDRAEEVLGLQKDAITDRTYNDPDWSITTPDGDPIPDEDLPFARVISTEEPLHDVEHTIEWPGGTRRLLSVSGAPLYTAGGELEGAVFHIEDITERRAAERRLRRSEQRFRKVFENAAIGIVIGDDEGRVIRSNPAFQQMIGYSQEELQGLHFAEFTHPDDVATNRRRFQALLKGVRDRDQGEKRYVRKDGSVFWGRLTVSRLEGVPEVHHISLVEDIDEQKRYEETLREAKEEAEEASRLKSAMMANMSHEIRTPLTSINGFAEILKNQLEGQFGDFASRIYGSGQRLMKTLDSVLQLSRLEAGAYELEREEVFLSEVVEETAEMLRPRAMEKSVAFETDLPEGPVQGTWNEGALTRILENLLENAIKFTPRGGRVELRARETETEAVLEVEDTGVGIAEENRSRMFEAFKQESEGLAREYEGSGLGLAIVECLVDAHDGTIQVESEKGEGSCFTVRLPKGGDRD